MAEKYLKKHATWLFFFLGFIIQGNIVNGQSTISVEEILANIEAANNQADSFQARYSFSKITGVADGQNKIIADPNLPIEEYEYILVKRNDDFLCTGESFPTVNGIRQLKSKLTFHAANTDHFRISMQDIDHGIVLPAQSIYRIHSPLNLNIQAFGLPVYKALRQGSVQYEGLENVDGQQCHIIFARDIVSQGKTLGSLRIWLSSTVGWNPIKMEIYDSQDQLVGENLVEFKKWNGNVWFPSSGFLKSYQRIEESENVFCVAEQWTIKEFSSGNDSTDFLIPLGALEYIYDSNINLSFTPLTDGLIQQIDIMQRDTQITTTPLPPSIPKLCQIHEFGG